MKRILTYLLIISIAFTTFYIGSYADEENKDSNSLQIKSKSAILMEAETGKILYEYNSHHQNRPASVTKIMTLLLAYEAIKRGEISEEDIVTISEHASSFGGSTIFLDTDEKIPLSLLLKGIAVASGNDAAVAVGEYVGGSEEGFVKMMNQRAKELGMKNTNFVNPCGLDADGHLTTAYDIALMSRELIINHPEVLELTSIFHDTLTHQRKNGTEETDLANTNKLVKYYPGCNGLKTGFTSKAMYSLSATAERDGLKLIAVVMGAPDKNTRTKDIVSLLDYGFGNYQMLTEEDADKLVGKLKVKQGLKDSVDCYIENDFKTLVEKGGAIPEVTKEILLDEKIDAPINEGQIVGQVKYYLGEKEIGTSNIIVKENIDKATFSGMIKHLINSWF